MQNTIVNGSIVMPFADKAGNGRLGSWKVDTLDRALLDNTEEGTFVLVADQTGYTVYARLVGDATVVQWDDLACQKIETWEVDTVVRAGAIWGSVGAKRRGTFLTRSFNLKGA